MTRSRFVLVRQYNGKTRRTFDRFDTYEAAAVVASRTPDDDGQLVPNVEDKAPAGYEYERGFFWHGNRYAIIYQDERFNV